MVYNGSIMAGISGEKEMNIRKLKIGEIAPIDLLLVADPSRKLIKDYINRGECYIAEVSTDIVGVYVLLPTRPETVELVNLSVVRSEQGKGIGKQLILHAIQIAKERAFKTIEIGTGNSSVGQLALYQKCGFRIVGVDIDYFIRHYPEAIYENGIQCRDMIRLSKDL